MCSTHHLPLCFSTSWNPISTSFSVRVWEFRLPVPFPPVSPVASVFPLTPPPLRSPRSPFSPCSLCSPPPTFLRSLTRDPLVVRATAAESQSTLTGRLRDDLREPERGEGEREGGEREGGRGGREGGRGERGGEGRKRGREGRERGREGERVNNLWQCVTENVLHLQSRVSPFKVYM